MGGRVWFLIYSDAANGQLSPYAIAIFRRAGIREAPTSVLLPGSGHARYICKECVGRPLIFDVIVDEASSRASRIGHRKNDDGFLLHERSPYADEERLEILPNWSAHPCDLQLAAHMVD